MPPPRLALLLALFALSDGCASGAIARPPSSSPVLPATSLWLEGDLDREGHYARPFETRRSHVALHVAWDGVGAYRLDWTEWDEGGSRESAETETTWHTTAENRVARRAHGAIAPLEGADAEAYRFCMTSLLSAQASTVFPYAHPRLGDVDETATLGARVDGVPSTARIEVSPLDERWVLTLRGIRAAPATPLELPVLPTPPAPSSVSPASVTELAPGLTLFTLADVEARTVVLDAPEGLIAMEAPLSSDVGERMLAAIRRRFPDKALRAVLVGHYHPHYTGGVRAFAAAGAKVIATPAQADYVRWLLARPFTRRPDAWAARGAQPDVEVFHGTRSFGEGTTRLDVHDIGAASSHTDEYVVYHHVASRTLLQDDLGWRISPTASRASRRAVGLLRSIEEKRLPVDRLVQLWPVRDQREVVSLAELQTLVAALPR